MPHVPPSVKAMIEEAREQVILLSCTACEEANVLLGRCGLYLWRLRKQRDERHATSNADFKQRHFNQQRGHSACLVASSGT
jgi:hypothetical protein